MNKFLLITRPEHDQTTRYLSYWSKKIIEEAEGRGVSVIDLHKKKANRKRTIGILKKKSPELILFNGHGNENCVTGHDNEPILTENDREVFNSNIIFSRSCKSAKVLGPLSVKYGAKAFLGYREDFWLMYNADKISRPLEDKTAVLFLEPSNSVVISLLKGHKTGDANEKGRNLFKKNIEKLLVSGPSADDYSAIKYLYWNMINQVCLGDKEAKFI